MRSLIFTLIAFTLTLCASAQEKKSSSGKWKAGGTISVFGGQTGSRNWAGGVEKFAFSFNGTLNLYANTAWRKTTWENNMDIAYGMMNAHSAGVRKNDDKLDFYSIINYGKKKFGIAAIANLRTQITNGYDYSETPKRRISGFFAPAYITGGVGLNYKPAKNFNAVVGWGARFVAVTNAPYSFNYQGGIKPDGSTERSLAEMYGVEPARQVRFETGLMLSARFQKEILKNVTYRTRLDLNHDVIEDPFEIDVYWTNYITMKVNNWLNVVYNFDLLQDNDVRMFGTNGMSPAVQMKSVFGVGLAANL